MEPSQLKRRKNSFKEENLEKVPLISKDDDLVKPKPTSGLSVKRIVKTFFRALWYLPLFISIGGVLLLFAIQLKHCGGPECGMKCMSGSFNDWEGCVQECKCWFVPPAFWLQPFRAEHSVHHDEDRIANCPNGYAFTPKLQPLSENPPVKRPNFVLILLDDQDEVVSPYMEAMPFTRELFEKNGTRFTQAFSSTSLCCPARCQLLTGLYGHNTGVLYNTGPFGGREGFVHPRYTNGTRMKNEEGKCINNEYRDAASLLKENGQYSSGIFGKYISGVEYGELGPKPPGWSDFHVGADHKIYFGYHYSLYNWTEGMENVEYEFRNYDKSDYLTDVLRDRAVQFIDRQRVGTSEEKPLFMFMAPTAPHFPIHAAPRHKHMEGYWASRFDEIVASRPSFYNMTDVLTSKSKWLINDIPRRFALKENPFTRADFVKRMTSLMAVDEMIEAIYRKLENLGEANNTIFVFSSDNGYNFGAHGLAHKMTPYEESVRVPLYISGPGFPRGKNVTEMTALIDVLPTFLESSGFQVPNYMDGFSLIPKMKSGEPQLQHKRKAVLLEYKGLTPYYANATMEEEIPGRFAARNPPAGLVNCDTPPFKAIRTEDHMLVDYIYFYKNDPRYSEKDEIETIMEKTDHEYELYDLKKDPYQMNNLFKEHGKNSEVFQKLMADMKKLQKCSGKNCYSL